MLPDIDRIVESAICTPFDKPLVRSSDEDSLLPVPSILISPFISIVLLLPT